MTVGEDACSAIIKGHALSGESGEVGSLPRPLCLTLGTKSDSILP